MAEITRNDLKSSSKEPLRFFINSYKRSSYLTFKEFLINDFNYEHKFDPSLVWDKSGNKFTYIEFTEAGVQLNHEKPFIDIFTERLDEETENSKDFLIDAYENYFIPKGPEAAENFIVLQSEKISTCLKKIPFDQTSPYYGVLFNQLSQLSEFLSTFSSSPAPLHFLSKSFTNKLFCWESVPAVQRDILSDELFKLLIRNDLISATKYQLRKLFNGNECKYPVFVHWNAVNPKNGKPSYSSIFYLLHSLSDNELISSEYPTHPKTNRIIHSSFCLPSGSLIPMSTLKHSKSDYLKSCSDPKNPGTNPNHIKIYDITQSLKTLKSAVLSSI